MSNSLNSNPIYIDTDITSWRAAQTLNTANLPSNAQQLSGTVTAQWGIRVTKIQVIAANTTPIVGLVTVLDPNDSTLLYEYYNSTTTAGVGQVLYDSSTFDSTLTWRDFKVTGATAAKVALLIWYRD